MYKTNDFANMLGITSKTLRAKHKSGELVPTYINEKNNYRFYSDELAYKYNNNKYVLVYTSKKDNDRINLFTKNLRALNIKFKTFANNGDSIGFNNNEAIKEILQEVNKQNTYTIIYDKYSTSNKDIEVIEFYLNACFPFIKIKDVDEFSLESSNEVLEGN